MGRVYRGLNLQEIFTPLIFGMLTQENGCNSLTSTWCKKNPLWLHVQTVYVCIAFQKSCNNSTTEAEIQNTDYMYINI